MEKGIFTKVAGDFGDMKTIKDNHEHIYRQEDDTCETCWLMRSTIEGTSQFDTKEHKIGTTGNIAYVTAPVERVSNEKRSTESWEERFDKAFGKFMEKVITTLEIKYFIAQEIGQAREEAYKHVLKEMKKIREHIISLGQYDKDGYSEGHAAMDDAIDKITTIINKLK